MKVEAFVHVTLSCFHVTIAKKELPGADAVHELISAKNGLHSMN